MVFMELRILHEEPHFLIIDKPVGLFSQAAPGVPSVRTELATQIKRRDEHLGTPFVGLPHRLDRGTSGAMLIARNQRALKRFGEQFQSRKIGKYYLVAVAGKLGDEKEEWQDYVRKIEDQPLAEICGQGDQQAKLAHLSAVTLACDAKFSLLLVKLHTGRMHQIRIQAASRGLPILGDTVYGGPNYFEPLQLETDGTDLRPVGLHALRLEFRHPQSAKQMAVTASPPAFWEQLPLPLRSAVAENVAKSHRDRGSIW